MARARRLRRRECELVGVSVVWTLHGRELVGLAYESATLAPLVRVREQLQRGGVADAAHAIDNGLSARLDAQLDALVGPRLARHGQRVA